MAARILAALAVMVALIAGGAAPAVAHTDLVDSTPEAGQTLTVLPKRVVVTFNEELQAPSYIVVTAPSGEQIASGAADVDGTSASAPISGTEPGVYTLAYRVVSSDGHPVTGKFEFTLASATASPSPSGPEEQAEPGPVSKAPAEQEPAFWAEHGTHTAMAVGLLALAVGLLWFERRRHI